MTKTWIPSWIEFAGTIPLVLLHFHGSRSFFGVWVCVCVSVRGILEYGWPQLMFARMYVCVHGALSLVHSSILVAASKHHVEHGTYSVLRPAGIAGGDVK